MLIKRKVNNKISDKGNIVAKVSDNNYQLKLRKIEVEIFESKLKKIYQTLGENTFDRLKNKKVISINVTEIKKKFNEILTIKSKMKEKKDQVKVLTNKN